MDSLTLNSAVKKLESRIDLTSINFRCSLPKKSEKGTLLVLYFISCCLTSATFYVCRLYVTTVVVTG
jgi:hypothetical protein